MNGADDDLYDNLRDLEAKGKDTLKWEQWATWIGGGYLAYIALFRIEHLFQYLGFGCLFLLFRIVSLLEQSNIQQKRNEAVLHSVRRKLTEIRPDL